MKHTLTKVLMTAGLVLSTSAFAQDETVTTDSSAETKERHQGDRGDRGDRGDNKNRGDRNNDRSNDRSNGDLSNRALRVIDTDEDGQVSVDEYMAHAQQRFADLDLDGNNFVTTEEAKEAAEIMRERQKEARSNLNKRKQDSGIESESE